MDHYVCIHGHFYQPPRENPWLEQVELQDSAHPYHDWNARVNAECYAPNTASRILDEERKIIDIVNNYSRISFNYGPTLLSWMAKNSPDIYRTILEADKFSIERFSGHGSAIAQAYNHMIMPLANRRDKITQVIWGIKDFEFRFKRKPEGMWLPETAVDIETLDIMAQHGIKFTILAPHQAKRVKRLGDKRWKDLSGTRIRSKRPYLCKLPSGRSIALFFYDGPISHDVAFRGLLQNGEEFAKRLLNSFSYEDNQPQLVHIATDGETYGHHHRFGDMALAYCNYSLETNNQARLTIYGEYLEKFPPSHEVEIFENSSWSCAHGIERWRSDCGCNSGMHSSWNQKWRAPLREAMDFIRDNLIKIFEEEMSKLIKDPWTARDEYVEVILNRSFENIDNFLKVHAIKELTKEERIKVLKLLEMQRHAMLMYTSCGWFFDDISGIETVQIIQYAARAIQLAKETSGENYEDAYIALLSKAQSNIDELKDGAKIYEVHIKPLVLDLLRVAAHYSVYSLFKDYSQTFTIYTYQTTSKIYDKIELGKQRLAVGMVHIRSEVTLEEEDISFAVLYLGHHNITGGARRGVSEEAFSGMYKNIKEKFMQSQVTDVVRTIDDNFTDHSYSLWHLFKDEQRQIMGQIFESSLKDIEASFRQIYENHYPVMQAVEWLKMPLPKYFSIVLEFILSTDIKKLLESDKFHFNELERLVGETKRWSAYLDKPALSFLASKKLDQSLEKWASSFSDVSMLFNIVHLLKILEGLSLDLDQWKAQNIYFAVGKKSMAQMQNKFSSGDEEAKKWIDLFIDLGNYLRVKV